MPKTKIRAFGAIFKDGYIRFYSSIFKGRNALCNNSWVPENKHLLIRLKSEWTITEEIDIVVINDFSIEKLQIEDL